MVNGVLGHHGLAAVLPVEEVCERGPVFVITLSHNMEGRNVVVIQKRRKCVINRIVQLVSYLTIIVLSGENQPMLI